LRTDLKLTWRGGARKPKISASTQASRGPVLLRVNEL